MEFMKRHAAVALSAIAVTGGLLFGGGTASATAAESVVAAAGGTAPACVERTSVTNKPEGGVRVHLRNFCGKTMRVKVIVKYWSDSGCKTMGHGTGWLFQTNGGRYDRTVVC
ncbi:hypothetical protein [Actinokineospora iranica]|uniref:Alpha amylase inhibitor n=1 Tax=Actinokineospora iranica TaxID=1271860 RepID=A0A1G6JX47_9PSEU|nr:hypothetical protein [Actinokineospora iranica]SDC23287.1 hypothetical protein SAMN05216174_101603 [Actinokineospora iranica]